ncbi:Nif11-like leader peptide family natural product precursor [Oscillatoria sp. FACHB-1406]|uniref:Nif11 family protein n=1 Tax=Oscillatoria sp. FACHB-1406 TaxID=2692846 RepID=UPI0016843B3A|nr:Nif11-like leader peptide family natural product precursor [Oscillatoria sp. FACHB-1406]MBD2580461.1 Nif11 family protein [Oscillatoria sp. FACHB-1406]
MSKRQLVIRFFQTACGDRELQDRLKSLNPPNRQTFAAIAQEKGQDIEGEDLDEYVRFAQFYEQFQDAIARHQNGEEHLATWLNKWEKHLKKLDEVPHDDRRDTIKRYL